MGDLNVNNDNNAQGAFNVKYNRVNKNPAKFGDYEISDKEIPVLEISKILSKPPEDRSTEEIARLKHFIMSTKIVDRFAKDNIDEVNSEKIITLSCEGVNLLPINKNNTIIYLPGQESGLLYVVVSGEVLLQTSEKYEASLTGYQYYQLLINVKKSGDLDILEKIISENYFTFPGRIEDANDFEKIFLKLILLEKEKISVDEALDRAKVDYKFFGLEKENDKEGLKNKVFLKEKLDDIPVHLCDKYSFFDESSNAMKVTLYKYQTDQRVKPKYTFGDTIYNKFFQRAVGREGSMILTIKKAVYLEYLKKERKKSRKDEIQFFLENFWFQSIHKMKFKNEYLNYFQVERYAKNKVLFEEGSAFSFIYFIYDGEVELSSQNSALGNHLLLNSLRSVMTKENEDFEEINYSFLNNSLKDLERYLNKNTYQKFFLFQKKESIGIESFAYNLNYLYTAKVVSEKAMIYRISFDKLLKIFQDKNDEVFYAFEANAKKRLKIIFERVSQITENLFKNCDKLFSILHEKYMIKNIKKIKLSNSLKLSKSVTNLKKIELLSSTPHQLNNIFSPSTQKINPALLSTTRGQPPIILGYQSKVPLENKKYVKLNPKPLTKNRSFASGTSFEDKLMKKIMRASLRDQREMIRIKKDSSKECSFGDPSEMNISSFKKRLLNKKIFSLTSLSQSKSMAMTYNKYANNFLGDSIGTLGKIARLPYNFNKTRIANEKIQKYSVFDKKKRKAEESPQLSLIAKESLKPDFVRVLPKFKIKKEKIDSYALMLKTGINIRYKEMMKNKLNELRYYDLPY